LCLVNAQVASTEVLAIQRLDRVLRSLILHLHETEAARAASLAIDEEVAGDHFAVLREQLRHFFFGRGEGKIPYVDPLAHVQHFQPVSAPARTTSGQSGRLFLSVRAALDVQVRDAFEDLLSPPEDNKSRIRRGYLNGPQVL